MRSIQTIAVVIRSFSGCYLCFSDSSPLCSSGRAPSLSLAGGAINSHGDRNEKKNHKGAVSTNGILWSRLPLQLQVGMLPPSSFWRLTYIWVGYPCFLCCWHEKFKANVEINDLELHFNHRESLHTQNGRSKWLAYHSGDTLEEQFILHGRVMK